MSGHSGRAKFFFWIIMLISGFVCFSCAKTMEPVYSYPPARPTLPPYGQSVQDVLNMMGQAEQFEKAGNLDEAARLYYRIATSYPGSETAPEALYRLGRIMYRLGRWHDATVYYLYLVNNYPQWPGIGQAYDELARAFLLERRVKEALDVSKRISDDGKRNFILGVAAVMDGNVRKGVKYLNAFVASPGVRRPDVASEDIAFLAKVLSREQLQAVAGERELPPELRAFIQASLGKHLLDAGRVPEGQELLRKAGEGLGSGHYLALAIQSLSGVQTQIIPEQQRPALRPEPLNVATADPGNPKKIGLMVPLSGSASGYGYQVFRGASLAVALWNEHHSEDTVELVVQDTQPEAQATVKAFEKLVNEDKVIAIIGPMSRQGVEALEGSAQPLPLLVLSLVPPDSSGGMPPYGSYIIKFLPDVRAITERLVDYSINNLGYKSFAILYPDESFGQQARDAFLQSVQSRGGQVIAQAGYPAGSTKFKAAIENLIGRKKEEGKTLADKLPFQALFLPDDLKTVSLLVPQLFQENVVGVTFLGSHLWDNPRFASLSGGYLDGAYYVTPYFIQSTDEVSSVFKSRFQAMYKSIPQLLEAAGYDATNIVLQIRSRAEKSRMGLLRVVQSGFAPSGSVTGVKQISPYGIVERSYKVITVRGSEPVKVAE